MAIDLKSLVGKLDDACRKTLEQAAGLTLSRTNYNVEIEHWLIKLLEIQDSDLAKILPRYEVDIGRLTADLTRAIDRFKTGNGRAPALSPNIVTLASQAWLLASIDLGAAQVRSGHLLLALLTDETLSMAVREAAGQLSRIPAEGLKRDFEVAAEARPKRAPRPLRQRRARAARRARVRTRAPAPSPAASSTRTPSISRRARAPARSTRSSAATPRSARCIDILMRRRQNNPILTGEAGVGKTAVVEGFAARIVAGDVPPALKNVAVRTLDLGLLQAGAGVKGEFENRLKRVIAEVKASPKPIILFIDEAHTMIGAGGQAGQGDAANLLKPALARGELRTIAATTWAEYKKYFEKDAGARPALPGRQGRGADRGARAIDMMRGLAATLEKHHKVRILDEAVEEAVKLSHRYITGRQLPDKSVSLLDTACARVAIGQAATPAAVEDCRRAASSSSTSRSASSSARRRPAPSTPSGSPSCARPSRRRRRKRLARLEERWEEEKEAGRRDPPSCATQARGRHAADTERPPTGRRREAAELEAEDRRELQGAAGRERRWCSRCVDAPGDRRGRRGLDRHPGRQDGGATRSRRC